MAVWEDGQTMRGKDVYRRGGGAQQIERTALVGGRGGGEGKIDETGEYGNI